ncbi:MAG: hypothetical protein ABJE47_06025 [bacterium]
MFTVRRSFIGIGAGLMSLALASAVGAQGTRARSDAFTGCWRALPGSADSRTSITTSGPLVCVLPAGTDSLEFSTIADGRVVSRTRMDASGRDAEFDAQGCRGMQSAKWSSDGRRLYTHSSAICSGGLQRNTTGLFALTSSGDWLDIENVNAGEGTNVRVIRYHDATNINSLPPEIGTALGSRANAMQAARLAAGSSVTTAEVLETSKAVSPSVAESWLLERHQQFSLDARKVAELADGGMPDQVIDAMVASSYPRTFTVAHVDGAEGQTAAIELVPDTTYARRRYAYMNPWAFSPYGYGGYYGVPYGAWSYDPGYYGWSDYGYGYGNGGYGYGYGGYGYGFGYGGYGYRPPVIILSGNVVGGGGTTAHAVKGKGYTRDASPSPQSTGSRSPSPQPASGSSGSSSSGSSSGGRTAKPRSP